MSQLLVFFFPKNYRRKTLHDARYKQPRSSKIKDSEYFFRRMLLVKAVLKMKYESLLLGRELESLEIYFAFLV